MSDLARLITLARDEQSTAVTLRRAFHARPELRFQEEETLRAIAEELHDCFLLSGMDIRSSTRKMGGIWIDLTVNPNFDRLLFRADVDALPVAEQTGLSYTSKTPGVMHACGHDAHISMLLAAFHVLVELPELLNHNLRFVFQRAEENPNEGPSGGYRLVHEDGVLEGVSRVYGLHVFGRLPPGQFASRRGPFFANSDRVLVSIETKGGHVMDLDASRGHADAANATEVLASAIIALRLLRDNYPCPDGEHLVIGPAPAVSGSMSGSNVKPSEAKMWVTARSTFSPEQRDRLHSTIRREMSDLAHSYGQGVEIKAERFDGHPALRNDELVTGEVAGLLQRAGQSFTEHDVIMGGEDFAWYLQQKPGAFFFLGANKPGAGDHHSPTFDIDESILWKGVLFWLLLACS